MTGPVPANSSGRLSATERFFVAGGAVFATVVEGRGELPGAALRQAVSAAAQANPTVRSVLRGRLVSTRWLDSGCPPPVRALCAPDWDGRCAAGAGFLLAPLPATGPTCEVLWVTSRQRRYLILRAHHGIMDGRGALMFLDDVFRGLRGEALVGSGAGPRELDVHAALGTDWQPPAGEHCPSLTGLAQGESAELDWRRVRLAGVQGRRLLPRLLLAIADTARANAGGRVQIEIPVDLRPLVESDTRAVGNLSATIALEIPAQSTIRSLRQAVQQKLHGRAFTGKRNLLKHLHWLPVWLLRRLVQRSARRQHRQGCYPSTATLSNLGRIPVAAFQTASFAGASVFLVARPAFTPLLVLATGSESAVELVFAMPCCLGSHGRLERVARAIKASLTAKNGASTVHAD